MSSATFFTARILRGAAGLMCAGLLVGTAPGAEPSPTEVAQMLVKRYSAAIVNVSLVLQVSGSVGDKPMPPREVKHEALATLISAGGLAMVSLDAIDPSELLDGMRVNTPKGPMKIESPAVGFKLVRLRLPNGTEVPARVVLKDPDLGVAFIKPIATLATPQVWVDLANEAFPQLLSTGYILGRSSRATQSAPQVRRSDIISVTLKPRRRIVPEVAQPSCPVFDATGKLYGLCVRLYANGRATGSLVLPAADIAEIAKQAAAIVPEPEAMASDAPADTPKG